MSISGNLKTMEASELLQWLAHTGKTGTLAISDGRTEKKVFFDRGTVIMTASSDPKEYLGHFLVSHGLIDEVTLAEAMEKQESNKALLGKILVTSGAISEEALNRMLRLKVEAAISNARRGCRPPRSRRSRSSRSCAARHTRRCGSWTRRTVGKRMR